MNVFEKSIGYERKLTWDAANLLLHLREGEICALLDVLGTIPSVAGEVLSIVLLCH
jgi:hypothetical protein